MILSVKKFKVLLKLEPQNSIQKMSGKHEFIKIQLLNIFDVILHVYEHDKEFVSLSIESMFSNVSKSYLAYDDYYARYSWRIGT